MPGDPLTWLIYAALGVFVGFFSGLLGIGGGSMIVPTLGLAFVAFGFAPVGFQSWMVRWLLGRRCCRCFSGRVSTCRPS